MYHALVRREVRGTFSAISRGDWDAAMRRAAADVEHTFPGEHPLGGVRHSRDAVRRWFERLGRLFPEHTFTVHDVAATGWPWRTRVAVAWTAHLHPVAGAEPYANEGAHWLELRWGRVTRIHAHLDTQRAAAAFAQMAAAGVQEAAASPIVD